MKGNYLSGVNLVLIAALCFVSCKKESEEFNNKPPLVTVTDCNLNGWVDQRNPNTTITFTTGFYRPSPLNTLFKLTPSVGS